MDSERDNRLTRIGLAILSIVAFSICHVAIATCFAGIVALFGLPAVLYKPIFFCLFPLPVFFSEQSIHLWAIVTLSICNSLLWGTVFFVAVHIAVRLRSYGFTKRGLQYSLDELLFVVSWITILSGIAAVCMRR